MKIIILRILTIIKQNNLHNKQFLQPFKTPYPSNYEILNPAYYDQQL